MSNMSAKIRKPTLLVILDGFGMNPDPENNAVVEVFASSDTGTWTITVTNASGVTCLVASGQAFEIG